MVYKAIKEFNLYKGKVMGGMRRGKVHFVNHGSMKELVIFLWGIAAALKAR